MVILKPLTANTAPHPAHVAPLADQGGGSEKGGKRDYMPCPSQVVLSGSAFSIGITGESGHRE